MKTVLYMHAGSGNHGCEALIRTTSAIIKKSIDTQLGLWSFNKAEEYKYGSDKSFDFIVTSEEIKRGSLDHFKVLFKRKILKEENASYSVFMKSLFKNSVAVAIGGDNYCYPWSAKQGMEIDELIRPYCKKSVLWGCSVEEKDITPELQKDFAGYDLITVREPISYATLKKINKNVVKVADPAFTLETKRLPLPKNFIENNTVGINLSPLIMDYEKSGNIAFDNYVELIKYILNNTDMNVCLIPHVVWEHNNDFKPLDKLYDMFKDTNRVVELKDHNCEELKGYISRCRFFVGARTHATIAAYSSLVPTLVVGYSVKSRGIALDLFDTYENYVLPVQELKSKEQLTANFKFIMDNETQIKSRLKSVMPEYIKTAYIAGDALKSLLK